MTDTLFLSSFYKSGKANMTHVRGRDESAWMCGFHWGQTWLNQGFPLMITSSNLLPLLLPSGQQTETMHPSSGTTWKHDHLTMHVMHQCESLWSKAHKPPTTAFSLTRSLSRPEPWWARFQPAVETRTLWTMSQGLVLILLYWLYGDDG